MKGGSTFVHWPVALGVKVSTLGGTCFSVQWVPPRPLPDIDAGSGMVLSGHTSLKLEGRRGFDLCQVASETLLT